MQTIKRLSIIISAGFLIGLSLIIGVSSITPNAWSTVALKAIDILYNTSKMDLPSDSNVQAAADVTVHQVTAVENLLDTNQQQIDGRTSCNSGMGKINGINSCIDKNRHTESALVAFNYTEALDKCHAAGKHLCRSDELYSACKQSGLINDLGAGLWEWSGTPYDSRAFLFLMDGSCGNSTVASTTDLTKYRFRCCL